MKYYFDLTLIPGHEIGIHFLWEKVFQQIHLRLVEMKDSEGKSPIALAFPEYDVEKATPELGRKLRFFASEASTLEEFDCDKTLRRFSDYVHSTRVRDVPPTEDYAIYKRQQPKSNLERLARRKAKRHGMSLEEALKSIKGKKEERIKTPFIRLKSHSSDHRFRLFIDKKVLKEAETPSVGFNCYGFSQVSTVPEF